MTFRLSTVTAACVGVVLLFMLGRFLATHTAAMGLQVLIVLLGLMLAVVIPAKHLLLITVLLLPLENALPPEISSNAFHLPVAPRSTPIILCSGQRRKWALQGRTSSLTHYPRRGRLLLLSQQVGAS